MHEIVRIPRLQRVFVQAYVRVLVDGVQLEEGEDRNEKVHEDPVDCVALIVILEHIHDLLAEVQERVH